MAHAAKHLAAALVIAACSPAASEPITVELFPIPAFNRQDSDQTQFGALRYLGGFRLESDAPDFGGFSGLDISDDGTQLTAITDYGHWYSANIIYGDGSAPSSMQSFALGPILGRDGKPLTEKADADSESLSRLPDGSYLVGFERHDRIWKYSGHFSQKPKAERFPIPAEIARISRNKGLEGLAAFPPSSPFHGAVIAMAERHIENGHHTGWIIGGPKAGKLHIKRIDGFDITDAAFLPNGDLLILERFFKKPVTLKCQIRRIPAASIKAGATLDGEVLFHADRSLTIDNMEGIAIHTGTSGQQIITLISDDNFSFFQRTLLLQFELTR